MNEFDEEYEAQEPKKKRFNIFNWYYRDGKGVVGDDINILKEPTIKNFFKTLWRKLGKLMSANLIFIICNFPIFFLLLAMSGMLGESSYAPLTQQWGILEGASLFEQSPEILSYINIFGTKVAISTITTPTIVFFSLGALLIFTMGFAKIGTSYIYRNIVLGEPIFPFSDFLYIAKRNIKQALIFGIIDTLIIAMFVFNLYFLIVNIGSMSMSLFMLLITIIMACVYFTARQYAYLMIFTFKLPLKKIIKNSLYFVMLGAKRNFIAFLFTVVVIALNIVLFRIYMPLGMILPFVITFAIIDFIGVYFAYPNIDKYMVDHSVKNEESIAESADISTENAQ